MWVIMPISLRNIFEDIRKILELAEKPDGDDFRQILKITFLGLAIVGLAAFAISIAITYIFQLAGIGIPS